MNQAAALAQNNTIIPDRNHNLVRAKKPTRHELTANISTSHPVAPYYGCTLGANRNPSSDISSTSAKQMLNTQVSQRFSG